MVWTFEAYETDAGNRIVQEWYWEEICLDDRDLIRDRIRYLKNVGRHLWKEPYFESMGELGEIKKRSTPRGALRIYGCFREGAVFLFLHGVLKKARKDKKGINTSKLRLRKLQAEVGRSHEFEFKERST